MTKSLMMKFHDATKHSEMSIRTSGHYLDWTNRPFPFKRYRDLPWYPLPHEFPRPKSQALKTIRNQDLDETRAEIDLGVLAEILFFSAGLTRKMKFGSEVHYMRAAPATGALYPIELYVVTGKIDKLEAGVYHFNPFEFNLVRLRQGDFRGLLGSISDESCATSPFTIIFTSLAWRNAWKYEARSYRHWFWDSGVIASNLLATCTSEGLPAKLVLGFIDSQVDKLLGLEKEKEATVCVVPIGAGMAPSSEPKKDVPSLSARSEPLSRDEVDYPIIWEANKNSQLHNKAEVNEWAHNYLPTKQKPSNGVQVPLRPARSVSKTLEEVILQRGSSRRFAQQSISLDDLSTILHCSTGHVPFDFLSHGESLVRFYFIVNDVEGLDPGSYGFDLVTNSLEQLKRGRLRSVSGYLALGQPLFSDASVMFFLMTNLSHNLESLGDRGYRASQFEAGVRAGKIYLSAYALGLGASGSTFYDDSVTEFFSPSAKDSSPMIAVGVGVPGYKAKSGKTLTQLAN